MTTATVFQRWALYTSWLHPEGAANPIPGSEPVALLAADGVRIAAWYRPPRPGRPVILFLHGKDGRLGIQSGRWQRIARAGAGILAVSYRGYAGSGGSPTEAGIMLDARAGYDWLRARNPADAIVVHGASLGTGVAVQLVAAVPARAVVLESPFTSAADVAAERFPWLPVHWLMWDAFASQDWISQLRAPLLVVHGDRDDVVPFAQGQALFAMARPPKQFIRMRNGTHVNLVRDGLYDHIWTFLGIAEDGRR